MSDIKRKTELFICRVLAEQVPGTRFLPSKGGDASQDAEVVIPPYCAIDATEAQRMIQDEPTYIVTVSATYVTHIDDTPTPAHSAAVRAVCDAIEQLPRGYDSPQNLMVHGSDISGTDSFQDDEMQGCGDVITFTVAVSG